MQVIKWTGNKIRPFKISPTSCFKFSANEVDWAHNSKGIFRTAHWNFLWGGSRNLYVVYFSLYARLNSIFEKKAPNLNVDVGEILNGPFLFPVHFSRNFFSIKKIAHMVGWVKVKKVHSQKMSMYAHYSCQHDGMDNWIQSVLPLFWILAPLLQFNSQSEVLHSIVTLIPQDGTAQKSNDWLLNLSKSAKIQNSGRTLWIQLSILSCWQL